jgi:hypothetical protein
MVDRLLDVAGLPVPCRGPPVERQEQRWLAVAKLHAQQLGEQVVVAVPLAVVIQRRQEQVAAFQLAEQLAGPLRLEHGVAHRARQPLQDRGPHQKRPDLLRLVGQDLGAQVVGHVMVVAV